MILNTSQPLKPMNTQISSISTQNITQGAIYTKCHKYNAHDTMTLNEN